MIDEKMIFTNSRGESLEFSKKRPYILTRIRDSLDADVQTQKAPFQDGTTYIDTLMDEREITLELAIFERTQTQVFERRAEILRVLNPKLGEGTLKYIYGDQEKEVKVVVERAPKFLSGQENRSPDFQSVRINLLCPSPFWLDVEETEIKFVAISGGLEFPIEIDPTMEFETMTGDRERSIINNGDVPTPVKIEFRGPSLNPKIENKTTGEYIKINQDLLENQRLIINTAFGNKVATLIDANNEESNALHYIDTESTFWNLIVGENVIEYTAETGQENAIVTLEYKRRYMGV